MKIEKIDLKKKVMLALLAGGMLCASSGLAADNTFNLNGAGEQDLSGYAPATLPKAGNTIVFNIHANYGNPPPPSLTLGDNPLVGAFDDSGNDVTLSGNNVTVEIDSGKYVVQNICGGFVKKGTVTGSTLSVTGGNVIPNYTGSGAIAEDQILGIAGGFAIDGKVTYNTVTLKDMASVYVAGGGYAHGADSYVAYNTIIVENCTLPAGSLLVGGAAMDMDTQAGNLQYNKVIINGTTKSEGSNSGIYGGINNGIAVNNPLPAIGNGVEINNGEFSCGYGIYGAYVSQETKDNYVIINGGEIKTKVHGSYTKSTATGDYVEINGGTFAKSDPSENLEIFGTYLHGSNASVSAKKNKVILNGGIFKNVHVMAVYNRVADGVVGGSANDGNAVIINNATFNYGTDNNIYGGYASGSSASAKYNSVTINDGTFKAESGDFGVAIYGGYSESVGAQNNTVTINNGTFVPSGTGVITIKGGEGGVANNNTVEINGGTFGKVEIIGGCNGNMTSGNTVTIKGGTFQGNDSVIYGGKAGSVIANSNNCVVIEGGVFTGTTKIVAADGGSGSSNSVTIKGTNALDLSGVTLMGFENTSPSGATLNVSRSNVKVGGVQNFGTIAFDLDGVSSDAIVLKMQGSSPYNLSNLGTVSISVSNINLNGDYVTLLNNVTGDITNITVSTTGGHVKVLGNDLIYYTGTEPTQPKGDYTIKQGNVKGDSGTTGSYSAPIQGNTDGSGLTVTGGSLSATSYSNNEVIIRRGTYNCDVYAVSDDNYNTANGNKIYIYDGTFGGNHSVCAVKTHGEAANNILEINGGTFGAADNWMDISGCYMLGGQKTVSNNEVKITDGTFVGKVSISGAFAVNASGANTYKNNKVYISNATFDLTSTSAGEINICGAYRNFSNYSASYNSVVIDNAKFNLDDDDKVNVYGAKFQSGGVDHNSVELHGGTYNEVCGGYTENGNANYNKVEIFDGTFKDGSKIVGGYDKGGSSNAEGNTVNFYGGKVTVGNDDDVIIYGGMGNYAIDNTMNIYDGIFEKTGSKKIQIRAGDGNNGGASGNKLNIAGGSFAVADAVLAAGASAAGNVTENVLTVSAGSFTASANLYGGFAEGYNANKNTVNITGGVFDLSSVSGGNINIAGGRNETNNSCEVNENKVSISNAEFNVGSDDTICVWGGYNKKGDANKNSVELHGGTYYEVIGGYINGSGGANNNTVKVYDGTFATICGGQSTSGSATGNTLEIESGTFGSSSKIYGGSGGSGLATKNTINIRGGSFGEGSEIYGGKGSGSVDVTYNTVNIIGGSFGESSMIYGGYSSSGSASYNTVTFTGGSFGNNVKIYGGYSESGNEASYNTVNILGDANADSTVSVYGGNVGSSGGTAGYNTVNIGKEDGTTTFNNLKFTEIFGGQVDGEYCATGNVLNVRAKISVTDSVSTFDTINFTLPSNIAAGDTMVTTGALFVVDDSGSATINVYAANGVKLKAGDIITLVNSESTSDSYVAGDILGGAAELCYEGEDGEDKNGDTDTNDLVITLLRDFEQKAPAGSSDQQKAPVEGIAAAVQTVNMSADLASGEGMASLVANTAGGAMDTFGAMSAGHSKYKTGSHVDVDGWGILVGAGKTKEWGNGEATSLGVFFEYGKGDFDTYNGSVHGDGNSENKGIGFMMRHKMMNNTYYEGNIRFGKQETEWGESEIGSYDTDSKYYGISVGMGHIFPAGKNEIDVYGRYTYGHVGACDAKVGDNHYHFDSVKSHRVRVGGKYNFKVKDSNAKPYVGLAWEHEFKGEARASISGVGEAPAPSMKGNTGIMEVGCDWKVSKKWTLGLGANAYIGKRKGWDGMARIFYNF